MSCPLTRRALLRGVLVTLAATWSQAPPLAGQGLDSDRLMAAFVYRFPQFVEWPDGALRGRDAMEICVAAPDPFGPTLEGLIEGEELNGRPLRVRRVDRARSLAGCHILFVGAGTPRTGELLEGVRDLPVLTIGVSPDFLDQGGIIKLGVVDRRMRFEVNVEAATRVGLRLSSQLLDLAFAVRGARS